MPSPTFFQKTLLKGYKNYSEDVGKALIHMGVVGWFFSALAQVFMIAKNDKIQKKDKKFLIPQEIADGAINVGLFYGVCKTLKSYGDKLCERGKIILESTDKVIGKIKGDNQTVQNYIAGKMQDLARTKKINESGNNPKISTIFKKLVNEIESIKNDKKKLILNDCIFINDRNKKIVKRQCNRVELLDEIKSAQSQFKANKNGIGVIATIAGSILACNLITPVCRNLVANGFQTKFINKSKPKPVFSIPQTKTFSAFRI